MKPLSGVKIPQLEDLKDDYPLVYQAVRQLVEAVNQHATEVNRQIGDGNDLATTPPGTYQPLGVVYFSNADHINSVPPPPDTDTDPTIPAVPNPRTPQARMRLIAISHERHTRVRGFR